AGDGSPPLARALRFRLPLPLRLRCFPRPAPRGFPRGSVPRPGSHSPPWEPPEPWVIIGPRRKQALRWFRQNGASRDVAYVVKLLVTFDCLAAVALPQPRHRAFLVRYPF